jgi:hypothetical protein
MSEDKKIVVKENEPAKFESGNVIINKKSTAKYADELSEINQSAGGNPIPNPKDKEEVSSAKSTTNAKSGGLLVGKSHAEGGMPAVVSDTGQVIEVEGGEAVIKAEAAEKNKERLSEINTEGGNGVPIKKEGGELEKGEKVELEHADTIKKIYDHKITPSQAPEEIAKDHLEEDKKYYSKLEKENLAEGGEINSSVFMNPEIYQTDKDWIVGGFNDEDLDKIKVVGQSDSLNIMAIDSIVHSRIVKHIEKFKTDIRVQLQKEGADVSKYTVEERINDDLSNVIESFLGVKLPMDEENETEYIADVITLHPAYIIWRSKIADRLIAFNSSFVKRISPVSNIDESDAVEYTNNSTLHNILEQLSNISENAEY